jgi:hypothetical protein
MWKHDASIWGDSASRYSDERTIHSFFNSIRPETREKWLRMAEAVMCVIPQAAPEPEKFDKAGYSVTPWSHDLPPVEPWDVPSADREDGVECLAFHRGKWCHVKWSQAHNGWSLGYGKAFLGPYGVDRPFAPLPSHVASASPDFYGWK